MTNEARVAEYAKKHFGECATANCGMKMFIIAFRNDDDIDIVFQDGTIVTNKRYKDFIKGKIANPNIGLGLKVYDRIGAVSIKATGEKAIVISYKSNKNIDFMFR